MTDAAKGKPDDDLKKVFVTATELGGALSYAMIHKDGRVTTDYAVMSDVKGLMPAVVQPLYDADHKRTGASAAGKQGAAELFLGFGEGSSVRGLWFSAARAAEMGKGAELDSLVARTAGRDPRHARREKAAAAGKAGPGVGD